MSSSIIFATEIGKDVVDKAVLPCHLRRITPEVVPPPGRKI
ncbi:MAG: hypothetical protein ACR2H4_09965 [Pyrinomonadaceae bacterium]